MLRLCVPTVPFRLCCSGRAVPTARSVFPRAVYRARPRCTRTVFETAGPGAVSGADSGTGSGAVAGAPAHAGAAAAGRAGKAQGPGVEVQGALCDAFPVTGIQVADQGFIAAPADAVAALVARPRNWRRWFPDLVLEVRADRGDKGVRWTVSGAVAGSMEVWLEPVLDGVVLHYFLHAEPAAGMRDAAAAEHARRLAGKAMVFEVKAALEAGRAPGEPPGRARPR